MIDAVSKFVYVGQVDPNPPSREGFERVLGDNGVEGYVERWMFTDDAYLRLKGRELLRGEEEEVPVPVRERPQTSANIVDFLSVRMYGPFR